jgi:hypothetical protein
VVTKVTLEEPALAQQMPKDWAEDLQLTQEQIGNAVPLGIAYHLGVAIADYLRPHLLARAEIEKGESEQRKKEPANTTGKPHNTNQMKQT